MIPNTCTMDFVEDIEGSEAFFARKFDIDTDSEIIDYFLQKTDMV